MMYNAPMPAPVDFTTGVVAPLQEPAISKKSKQYRAVLQSAAPDPFAGNCLDVH